MGPSAVPESVRLFNKFFSNRPIPYVARSISLWKLVSQNLAKTGTKLFYLTQTVSVVYKLHTNRLVVPPVKVTAVANQRAYMAYASGLAQEGNSKLCHQQPECRGCAWILGSLWLKMEMWKWTSGHRSFCNVYTTNLEVQFSLHKDPRTILFHRSTNCVHLLPWTKIMPWRPVWPKTDVLWQQRNSATYLRIYLFT